MHQHLLWPLFIHSRWPVELVLHFLLLGLEITKSWLSEPFITSSQGKKKFPHTLFVCFWLWWILRYLDLTYNSAGHSGPQTSSGMPVKPKDVQSKMKNWDATNTFFSTDQQDSIRKLFFVYLFILQKSFSFNFISLHICPLYYYYLY